jgi:general secretion pathway protein J
MITPAPASSDPRAGFTLLELLVALTLLGLLMAAMFSGLQLGARAWEHGEERLDQSARLQVVQDFLRDRLVQAYPLEADDETGRSRLIFEGTSDSLRFVTLMPEHLARGFAEFILAVDDHFDAKRLIVRWRPFEPSGAMLELADTEPQIKVLLEQIEDLEISYLGAPSRDVPADWYKQWLEATAMPELVRLHVSFPPGDQRHWPDLIVGPITDAARTMF